MKPFLLLLSLTVLTHSAFCQQKAAISKASIGGALAFPTGNSAQTYRLGYGGSIIGEYSLIKNLNIEASIGYLGFQYRKDVKARLQNYGEAISSNGVMPIKGGLKYYFGGIYYADFASGVAFGFGDQAATSFTYAPALGVCIPINDKYGADFGLRYERWLGENQSVSFFGARIGMSFTL